MNDIQRESFIKNVAEVFETIKKQINGEKIEELKKIETWNRNIYTGYRYAKTGENNKYALSQERIELLKQKLEEENITLEEYESTKGNIKKLAKIKQDKNYSIEDLKKMREELDKVINDLKQKQTQKYKQFYKPTEKEIEDNKKNLETCQIKRNQINKMIENLEQKDETENLKPQHENYNKKVQDLIEKTKEQEVEIIELEDKVKTLEANNLNIQERYYKKNKEQTEQLKKEYKEQTEQLEREYKEKLNSQKEQLEGKARREIDNLKLQLDASEKDRQANLEKLKTQFQKQQQENKEKQKEIIVKLLCTNDDICLNEIKEELEKENVNTEGFINTLKELQSEIPGIIKCINEVGDQFLYSIKGNALNQLHEYKKWLINTKISNLKEGQVNFIVKSDMHLNMTSSEYTIERLLYPYMDYCTKNGNIPIIDLGDMAETIKGIKYISWKEFDKNAIKLAYKFYKSYAKAISTAPQIINYGLLGNHDEHPYIAGIDPLQILFDYASNFRTLGVSSGSFEIGNDKIGVFHDKEWQNIISYKDYKKDERDRFIYEYLCKEINQISSQYTYSLIGHYHFGKNNPEKNFSVINNGIDNPLLFTAILKDGNIEKMYVSELNNNGIKLIKSSYETEVYNRNFQYKK